MRQTGSNGAGETTRRELGCLLEEGSWGAQWPASPRTGPCFQGQEGAQPASAVGDLHAHVPSLSSDQLQVMGGGLALDQCQGEC